MRTIYISFSKEDTLLGTGGALKKAINKVKSDTFFVLNGDSICYENLEKVFQFHQEKRADLTMVLSKLKKNKDFGSVRLSSDYRVLSFQEKVKQKNISLVNAGIYIMEKDIAKVFPKEDEFSLEYDLFPKLTQLRFYGYITDQEFFDIGTPARLKQARRVLF